MNKIKYGILGCGKHALQSHAIPSKSSSLLELYALCDLSDERMIEFEQAIGMKLNKSTDREQFFKSGIDAVLIATPDQFHFQDLTDAIDHGLHTFAEKPLAVTTNDVDALRESLHRDKIRRQPAQLSSRGDKR